MSRFAKCMACLMVLAVGFAHATDMSITLAVPGPGSVSHLPVDLIKKIGADKAEGVDLSVRYFGGGPLAYKEMLEKDVDFAVAGAPALAGLKAKGLPVVSVAALSGVPAFVFAVRSDLKGRVRSIADLKGRTIGVNSSSIQSKSTSQQVAEFALRRAGVSEAAVNFVPAGQSLEDQTAALDSRAVDALMGDEPFMTQLREDGKVYALLDLHDVNTCRTMLGGRFLNSQLATRADLIASQPEKVARMVRVMRRTLKWIAGHSAQEIAAQLDAGNPSAHAALLKVLTRHKGIYSPDGRFSEEQVRTAERFFRANHRGDPLAERFDFNTLIDPRWVNLPVR